MIIKDLQAKPHGGQWIVVDSATDVALGVAVKSGSTTWVMREIGQPIGSVQARGRTLRSMLARYSDSRVRGEAFAAEQRS